MNETEAWYDRNDWEHMYENSDPGLGVQGMEMGEFSKLGTLEGDMEN